MIRTCTVIILVQDQMTHTIGMMVLNCVLVSLCSALRLGSTKRKVDSFRSICQLQCDFLICGGLYEYVWTKYYNYCVLALSVAVVVVVVSAVIVRVVSVLILLLYEVIRLLTNFINRLHRFNDINDVLKTQGVAI